jgi:peptide/nickel transport system permease protein
LARDNKDKKSKNTNGNSEEVVYKTNFQEALDRFKSYRLALVGLFVLSLIFLMAIFANILAPQGPEYIDLEAVRQPPGNGHLLGTDNVGRDVWARVAFGARTSLVVGVGAVVVALAIGITVGLLSGFLGKWVDTVLMRITDAFMSVPALILIIIFIAIVGPSLLNVILVIALATWPTSARVVRGQVLTLREQEFITAARVVGVPTPKILIGHIFPNLLGPLSVVATFGIAGAILTEAGLSFLGLGVRPPISSWGQMVNLAQESQILVAEQWIYLPSGIMIVLTVLSVNFIGDGLRKAVDPKSVR